jgi:hypothetical protein
MRRQLALGNCERPFETRPPFKRLTNRHSTHFPYKNWYLRGDNWLLNNRWEQLISMRNDLTFVELITWNDFGEGN